MSSAGPHRDLFSRVRAGDLFALDQLIGVAWPRLVAYARRILADPDAAEDVVQDALIRFWEERDRWSDDTNPLPLLYRLTRNASLNEAKRLRIRRDWAERQAAERAATPAAADPAEVAGLGAALRAAIDALPPRRREVFTLSRLHAFTHAEIAEIMGISPQTVANQMVTALTELRERLAPWKERNPA